MHNVAPRSAATLTDSIYYDCIQDDLCTRSHQIAPNSKAKYHHKYHQLSSPHPTRPIHRTPRIHFHSIDQSPRQSTGFAKTSIRPLPRIAKLHTGAISRTNSGYEWLPKLRSDVADFKSIFPHSHRFATDCMFPHKSFLLHLYARERHKFESARY